MALPVQNPRPVKQREAKFELRLTPQILFEGSSAWLKCFVPESYGTGRIRLALEGFRSSEADIAQIENKLLLDRPPCGTWLATCAIATKRGIERREQTLQVRGSCDGDSK